MMTLQRFEQASASGHVSDAVTSASCVDRLSRQQPFVASRGQPRKACGSPSTSWFSGMQREPETQPVHWPLPDHRPDDRDSLLHAIGPTFCAFWDAASALARPGTTADDGNRLFARGCASTLSFCPSRNQFHVRAVCPNPSGERIACRFASSRHPPDLSIPFAPLLAPLGLIVALIATDTGRRFP